MASVRLEVMKPEVGSALETADGAPPADRRRALDDVIRLDPTCLAAWAGLGDDAYQRGDDVTAYACYRVGYHRGLDALRGAGWRPDLEVHWTEEPNRGFLRSLYGLMRAAAAIGEGVEARRCREFLLTLDPSDPLEVGAIAPKELNRRLAE